MDRLYMQYKKNTSCSIPMGLMHNNLCDIVNKFYTLFPPVHYNIVFVADMMWLMYHWNTSRRYSLMNWHHVYCQTNCHWINL